MFKKQIIINALSSILQFSVNTIVLFVYYRFLLQTIGVKDIGIWSLVLSISSLTYISSFGFSGGAVKFVAKYTAQGNERKASSVIQTSVISVAILVGGIMLLGYPAIKFFFSKLISDDSLNRVYTILPQGVLSLWLMMIANVIFSGLEGYQRMDIKNYLMIFGGVFNLLLCYLFVPKYGLYGLACIVVMQQVILIFLSWLFLKRQCLSLPAVPFQWEGKIFKEIIGYNLKFQFISITTMFYDPIIKFLLNNFGGLSAVGFYEMASKFTLQIRGFIVSANQALVPVIANFNESMPEKIRKVYVDSFNLLLFLTLPIYSSCVLLIPIISKVWIGEYNSIFICTSVFLLASHFINILSSPAYFTNVGKGDLGWILFAHSLMAIFNLIGGYIFGNLFGWIGVVANWTVVFIGGSSIIYFSFNHSNKIKLYELFPKKSINLALSCCAGLVVAKFIIYALDQKVGEIPLALSSMLFSWGVIFPLFWKHPMRLRSFNLIKTIFLKT